MATASNFEGFTHSDAYETNAHPAEAAKPSAAPFAVEAGKGYREIAGRKSVRVNPLAVLIIGILGIALGVGGGLWLTTGGFAHATVNAASAPAAASPAQPAPPQNPPAAASASPAQSSAVTPAMVVAPPAAAVSSHIKTPAASIAKPSPLKTAASAKARPAAFLLTKRRHNRLAPGQKSAVPPAQVASAIEAHIPALRPAVMVEGDVTVADFDGASGRIETREGKSFVLGHAASAFSWDELHANLHYRCDLSGNCALSHTRSIAANARREL
jgi:hypothetical protein